MITVDVINEKEQGNLKEKASPQRLTPIERELTVNLITSNLMACGVILPREISDYSRILRAYNDKDLGSVKDYSAELKKAARSN